MESRIEKSQVVRFATFEVDLRSGEVRKGGVRLKLSGQPFQVLTILLERPGEVVTREVMQKRLWPDTFVDVDHNLNTAINKIREVLGDGAENPRFVETLPRRGYRFIAPVDGARLVETTNADTAAPGRRSRALIAAVLFCTSVLLVGASWLVYKGRHVPASPVQRSLTRLTFDEGLQTGATWSPDGRFIAYSSNRGGKFDIWVQQISGGDPVQITKGSGQNWQPDWSPDGKYIAYRSEEGSGGLCIVPPLGGAGLQRRIASFGYFPRWSPDSSRILFQTSQSPPSNKSYIANLDGSPPREVLIETPGQRRVIFSAWHPDGKRISAWISDGRGTVPIPNFWTGPIEGSATVESEFPRELLKQIEGLAAGPGIAEWRMDFKFGWAPSGKAIYFERTFRGARNIWRMTIDPLTLQATTVERLTTAPGLDAELSLSPDGSKLAFTGESQQIRAWAFPFDATHGRVTGPGQPVTSPGIEAWMMNLSRDGKQLAIGGNRGGQWGTWKTSVPNGREEPIAATDSYSRDLPMWSPDGKRVAYLRANPSTGKGQIVEWSSETRNEEPLATWNSILGGVSSWSPDGRSLLITQLNDSTSRTEIWELPLTDRPHAETSARRITSAPDYDLWQSHFSADGRWIVFEATRNQPERRKSEIYAMAAAGGPWIRITDGKQWDDKPRWSPDGKMIYFLSDRRGFFNLWGVRFDPSKGKRQGDPFPVTSFESPTMMIPKHISTVEVSLTEDRLVVPLAQVSGSIWVLDDVDR